MAPCRGIKRKLGAGEIGIWQFGPQIIIWRWMIWKKIKNLARRSQAKFLIFFQIIHPQITIWAKFSNSDLASSQFPLRHNFFQLFQWWLLLNIVSNCIICKQLKSVEAKYCVKQSHIRKQYFQSNFISDRGESVLVLSLRGDMHWSNIWPKYACVASKIFQFVHASLCANYSRRQFS